MGVEGHSLRLGHGLRSPGHAPDESADTCFLLANHANVRVVAGNFGDGDAPAPVTPTVVVVVVVLAVLWRLVVMLMVSVLVVHNFVVVVVLLRLDVVPDFERVRQRIDHGHDQELAHQYRLDRHENHLDLLLEQVNTE